MLLRALISLLLLMLLAPVPAHAKSFTVPQKPPLETMLGQMIMVGFKGTGEEPLTEDIKLLQEDIRKGHIGGVIFFEYDWQTKQRGRNVRSTAQVASLAFLLQKKARIPLFIAVDQEGGRVERLRSEHGFTPIPSARDLGTNTPKETYTIALAQGKALRALGINLNFAPVVDLNVNPDSPAIGRVERSFSPDPVQVAAHGSAFARGLAEAKVASCYKHFPGHGSATDDSHHSLPDITASWKEEELLPYLPGTIPAKLPLMVMVGHMYIKTLDAGYPASLSRSVIDNLLRKTLKWDGVVITDDLEMNAISLHHTQEESILLAVNAGVDILLFGNNIQYAPDQGRKVFAILHKLVKEGKISQQRIYESWKKIIALKRQIS